MAEVIEHPAQSLAFETGETFSQFADRVYRQSKRPLQYSDGAMIELDPELQYSFMMFGMTRLLTPEEFAAVYEAMMTALAKAEKKGTVPAGLIKTVATPFDVMPPRIPDSFVDGLEEGAVIKTYLVGDTGFAVAKHVAAPEPEPAEE